MKVYIIGAGPGDPKLMTVRGAELVSSCPVILYTGSLVPSEVLATAGSDARIMDSSGLTLEEIVSIVREAKTNDQDVARVHTGDPTIFGTIAEQIREFEKLKIEYEIVPGVSSFTAAAAVLGKELTLPELSQTVILTRADGRTPMPPGESLAELAAHRSTLILFLSITLLRKTAQELVPAYGADCPVAVVHRATCLDQKIISGTLADIHERVKECGIKSESIIIIGRVLTATTFANSRLYAEDFSHGYRKAKTLSRSHCSGD
jgi:precorrin-4/cobalt-precorrin-4 C11-methyltransferase